MPGGEHDERVPGSFRDRSPHIERATAAVVAGELRIEPEAGAGYPRGFILRTSPIAKVWAGELVPAVTGATIGQRRVAGYQRAFRRHLVDRVQGEDGRWILFGEPEADAAFRPDDWPQFEELLGHHAVPFEPASPEDRPPEPPGGLVMLGIVAITLVIAPALIVGFGLTRRDVSEGQELLAFLAIAAAAVLAIFAVRRFWFGTILTSVSRRQRQRSAVDGRARPSEPGMPGYRTVLGFGAVGLTLGLALIPALRNDIASISAPAVGTLMGLTVGLVWVLSCRLTPAGSAGRRARTR